MHIHIADFTDQNVRMILPPSSNGQASTVFTYTVSGLGAPHAIGFDGTHIHIADTDDGNVRMILLPSSNGQADTVFTYTVSGLDIPTAITFDGTHIHIVDVGDGNVRMILPPSGNGEITADNIVYTYTVSGLGAPNGMTFDGTHIHIADTDDDNVRMILPPSADGQADTVFTYTVSGVDTHRGMTFDGTHIHISDVFDDNVRMILPPSGNGEITSDNIVYTYTVSGLGAPTGMAFDGEIQNQATLTLSTTDTDIRAGEPVDINIASDIDISNFVASDITVTGGTRGALTINSATSATLRVTAGSAGTMTVSIAEDVVDPGNAAVSQDFTVNARVVATITFDDTEGESGGSTGVNIALSESVTGLLLSHLTASDGILSNLTGSGTSWEADLAFPATGDGTVEIDLAIDSTTPQNAAASGSIGYTEAIPPIQLPSVPTSLSLTATHNSISAMWGVPANNGGEAPSRYDIRIAGGAWIDTGLDLAHVFQNLSPETQYLVQVAAVNSAGRGAVASAVITTDAAPIVITVPSVPRSLSLTEIHNSIVATWIAAADNGGESPIRFDIRINSGNWIDTGLDLTHTFSNLLAETEYIINVAQVNSAGRGVIASAVVTTDVAPVQDPLTGAAVRQGNSSFFGVTQAIGSIPRSAVSFNGELYILTRSNLIHITNLTNGSGVLIGSPNFGLNFSIDATCSFVYNSRMYFIDRGTGGLYIFDDPFTGDASFVGILSVTLATPSACATDGSTVWVIDQSDNSLHTIDPTTGASTEIGAIAFQINQPANNVAGALYYGGILYLLDNGTERLFQIADLDAANLLATVVDLNVSQFGVSQVGVNGGTVHLNEAYMAGGNPDALYRFLKDSGTPVNNVPVFGETSYAFTDVAIAVATIVGTVVATDDDNDTLTYTLTGADASNFVIDANGQITVAVELTNSQAYSFNVVADDGTDTTSVGVFATAIAAIPPTPALTFGSETVSNQAWVVGTAASITLPEVTGGTGSITYSLSPTLPAGKTFVASTRVLSGTPTGRFSSDTFTYTATDGNGDTVELTFTVVVTAPAFSFASTIANQSWIVGTAVSLTLPTASGGVGTLTYSLTPALVAGVTFATATRLLSGNPTATAVSATFTYRVTDSENVTHTQTFTIVVTASTIVFASTIAAQAWMVGTAVNVTLPTASGGVGTITYSLTPTLPTGATYTASTRRLGGTPTGRFTSAIFTYTAEDADGTTVEQTFTIVVTAVDITFASAIADQSWMVGTAVNLTLPIASGGVGTFTYTLTPALPAGVTFVAGTRVLAGTPTGRFASATFTYTVTDAEGITQTQTFSIVITAPAITFSPTSFSNQSWVVGTAVGLTLPAGSGGVGILTASLIGTLPSGVTFTASTRRLAGNPSATFTSALFTYRVTDAEGVSESITFMIVVTAAVVPLALGWIVPTVNVGLTFSVTLTSNKMIEGITTSDFAFRRGQAGGTDFVSNVSNLNSTLTPITGTFNWRLDITLVGIYDDDYYLRLIMENVQVDGEDVPDVHFESPSFRIDSSLSITTPGSPTSLSLTETHNSIVATWAAAVNNGGEDPSRYDIRIDGESWIDTGLDLIHAFASLSPETQYTIEIAQVNSAGRGSIASAVVTTDAVPVTTPSAPRSLSLTETHNSISASWIAALSDGGENPTRYDIRINNGNWIDTGLDLVHTFSNLSPETQYMIEVSQVNSAGRGVVASATVTTDAAPIVIIVPGPPTSLSLTETHNTIVATWGAAVDNGGEPPSRYDIRINNGNWINAGLDLTHTFSSLSPETQYTIDVAQVNSAGRGASASLSVTTDAAPIVITLPSAPRSLSLVATHNSIAATWIAAADNGGEAPSRFDIRINNGAWIDTGLDLSHIFSSLSPETQYTIDVVQVNSVGRGASASSTITTDAAPIVIIVPSVPTSLSLTATQTSISATWGGAANDGGGAATRYDIRIDGGNWIDTGLDLTHTFSGLSAETQYTVEVAQVNSAGRGDIASSTITTDAAPVPLALGWVVPTDPVGNTLSVTLTSNKLITGIIPSDFAFRQGIDFVDNVGNLNSSVTAIPGTFNWRISITLVGTYDADYFIRLIADSIEVEGVAVPDVNLESPVFSINSSLDFTVPSAPRSLSLSVTHNSILATWIAASDNGGASPLRFDIRINGGSWINTGLDLTHTFSGLSAETQYTIDVAQVNAAGRGAVVSRSITTDAAPIVVTRPSAPRSLSLVETHNSIVATWIAAANNGGESPSRFDIRINHGSWINTGLDLVHVFQNLSPETQYTIDVAQVNSAGRGADVTRSITTDTQPTLLPPQTLIVELTATTALLKWTGAADAGDLTAYEVSFAEGSTLGSEWVGTDSTRTRFLVKELKRGTQYTFAVRGMDVYGSGAASGTVTVRTPIASLHNALFFKECVNYFDNGGRVSERGDPSNIIREVADNDYQTFSTVTDYAIDMSRNNQPTRVDAVFIKSKGITRHSGTPTGGSGTGWTNEALPETVENWEGTHISTTVLGFQHHLLLMDQHFTATSVRVRFEGTNVEVYEILLLEFGIEIDANADFTEIATNFVDRTGVVHPDPGGGISYTPPLGGGRDRWQIDYVVKVVPGKTLLETPEDFLYWRSENRNHVHVQEFTRKPWRVFPAVFLGKSVPVRYRTDDKTGGEILNFRVAEQ